LECPAADLDLDEAAAGGAAIAVPQAVTCAADFQTLAVLFVIHNAAAIAHEGDDGLEKIRGLRRDGWQRLM
jgi:hypothetical protein